MEILHSNTPTLQDTTLKHDIQPSRSININHTDTHIPHTHTDSRVHITYSAIDTQTSKEVSAPHPSQLASRRRVGGYCEWFGLSLFHQCVNPKDISSNSKDINYYTSISHTHSLDCCIIHAMIYIMPHDENDVPADRYHLYPETENTGSGVNSLRATDDHTISLSGRVEAPNPSTPTLIARDRRLWRILCLVVRESAEV